MVALALGVAAAGERGSCGPVAFQHASDPAVALTLTLALPPLGPGAPILVVLVAAASVAISVPAGRGKNLVQIAVRFLLFVRLFVRQREVRG